MDNYTRKTQQLIKKFAAFFANQNIDKEFKSLATEVFDSQFKDYRNLTVNDKEFTDLRIALLENGRIKGLFPEIKTTNAKEKVQTETVLLNFIAFEATALPDFLEKNDYKFEELQSFINITYRPSENTSGNNAILSAYFNITVFFFTEGRLEYVIKPTVQYVLSPESKVSETSILKLI